MIEICCNGEKKLVQCETIRELLTELKLQDQLLAVELNLQIVPKTSYDTTCLKRGDQVEIVQFVGGG